jgi:hypothetical protein
MKLYFAHNFNDRKEFRQLEKQLEKILGWEFFNPFYDAQERRKEMERLDNFKFLDRERNKDKIVRSIAESRDIVYRDLSHLALCDGLFTIIQKPSIGTTLEIANAKVMSKPVYVVSEMYYNHPWIQVYATRSFKSIDLFITFAKRLSAKKKRSK